MAQLVSAIFGYTLAFAINVAVMMFGWGLEPHSWVWIVGGSLASLFVITLTTAAINEK